MYIPQLIVTSLRGCSILRVITKRPIPHDGVNERGTVLNRTEPFGTVLPQLGGPDVQNGFVY